MHDIQSHVLPALICVVIPLVLMSPPCTSKASLTGCQGLLLLGRRLIPAACHLLLLLLLSWLEGVHGLLPRGAGALLLRLQEDWRGGGSARSRRRCLLLPSVRSRVNGAHGGGVGRLLLGGVGWCWEPAPDRDGWSEPSRQGGRKHERGRQAGRPRIQMNHACVCTRLPHCLKAAAILLLSACFHVVARVPCRCSPC
jgi:hypothetical protein